MKNLLEQAFEAGKLWERYQFREIDSALDFETWFEQNCIKHGVSGKRPDCPYCMEPISKINLEMWQSWLDECKAACASGAAGTVAEGEELLCFCANGGEERADGTCAFCSNKIARKSSEEQP